jgi:hypothetical protein
MFTKETVCQVVDISSVPARQNPVIDPVFCEQVGMVILQLTDLFPVEEMCFVDDRFGTRHKETIELIARERDSNHRDEQEQGSCHRAALAVNAGVTIASSSVCQFRIYSCYRVHPGRNCDGVGVMKLDDDQASMDLIAPGRKIPDIFIQ